MNFLGQAALTKQNQLFELTKQQNQSDLAIKLAGVQNIYDVNKMQYNNQNISAYQQASLNQQQQQIDQGKYKMDMMGKLYNTKTGEYQNAPNTG